MKILKLSDRLSAVAKYVQTGASVIDVGTDHGYIPVYLAQNGIARRIVASDVKQGPLDRAMRSAAEYGVEDKIEFVLADGLSGADAYGVDTVIMAGMGGETIISILSAAKWAHSKDVCLILQPQSKIAELSGFLHENGFAILDESLVEDEGRIYAVMLAQVGEKSEKLTTVEAYAHRRLLDKRDPLLPKYLNELISKTQHALEGMEKSARVSATEKAKLESALDGFIRMRRETEQW